MDIEGLGVSVAQALLDSGAVKTPADLYRLEEESVSVLPRMGAKSARNLIAAIRDSKARW